MKSLGEVLGLAAQYLKEKEVVSPRLTAERLLAHLLGKKRIELYMHFECPLEEKELAQYRSFLKRASQHEPVEYITEEVEFFDCSFFVSRDVLIPRQETELLVDKVAQVLGKEALEGKVLWDLCSGSGCIGISLKKRFPSLAVYLSDQSVAALEVCDKNAKRNEVDVKIVQGDFLSPLEQRKGEIKYLLCNPPYVTEDEYEGLESSVKSYEPKEALVGGKTGLSFYEKLAKGLAPLLAPGAKVFLEIGAGQGQSIRELFDQPIWKEKSLFPDLAGHDRFFFLEME